MHIILTGAVIDAEQAERDGLVVKVVPADKVSNTLLSCAYA